MRTHAGLALRDADFGAYFICDRCSQRWRRSQMCVEWDNLRVCRPCLDPRPPQMQPPNVYPEGIPFPDARPPQDNPDRLVDDTFLISVPGGFLATDGVYAQTNAQYQPPGALSPQNVIVDPVPDDLPLIDRVTDDITLRTGPVPAPTADGNPGPVPLSEPTIPVFYTP